MSPLIKSGAAREVRSFNGVRAVVAAPIEPVADARDEERLILLAQIERLHDEMARAEKAGAKAIEEAREAGRREGAAQAAKREDDRIDLARKAMEQASSSFASRLEVLDGLAPALARTALAKLFDQPDGWSAPVEAMLARQLAALRRTTVVALRVSPEDFADPDALSALSAALGAESIGVEIDRELRAGASRIECKLGQIDLDLRDQWQALSQLLAEMAG